MSDRGTEAAQADTRDRQARPATALPASDAAPRYSAFISYCRSNRREVERVQRWLESYRLPRRLNGSGPAWDGKGRRLRPLFRDQDELAAGPDIGASVGGAIDASAWLLVMCTPQAAASQWVTREIAMFRAAHGDGRIVAALLSGEPAESFPEALRHDAQGAPLQPLAADFRAEGDGRRLAQLKLVALLAGVDLAALVQRDAQRRLRRWLAIGAGMLVTLLVVLGLTWLTMNARLAAEKEKARGGALSSYLLDDLRGQLKTAGRLDLLNAVNQGVAGYYRGQALDGMDATELAQRAKLLLAIADDDEQRGDLKAALANTAEAHRITGSLLAAEPADPQRQFAHAQSEYYLGMIAWHAGDRPLARQHYDAYRALARQLVAGDPRNPDWWMEVGYAEANLGTFTLRTTKDIPATRQHFAAALAAYERAAARKPGDRDIEVALADAEAWLADARRWAGDFDGALAARRAQRTRLLALQASDPADRQIDADLVTNQLGLARIALARGDNQGALALLAEGRQHAMALARSDTQNLRRAALARMFDLFTLRTLMAMPGPADAAALARLNGDCAADGTRLKNEELATFCRVLAARRTGSPMPPLPSAADNALSDRWGIDFREEAALPRLGGERV